MVSARPRASSPTRSRPGTASRSARGKRWRTGRQGLPRALKLSQCPVPCPGACAGAGVLPDGQLTCGLKSANWPLGFSTNHTCDHPGASPRGRRRYSRCDGGLVAKHGLHAVTMSRIAEETGIGRATLYKYFLDVESILVAWHDRHVNAHLEQRTQVRDRAARAGERLEAVLNAYTHILNSGGRGQVPERAASGDVRQDVAPDELASYCLHALEAASSLRSEAAVRRLVGMTLAGL